MTRRLLLFLAATWPWLSRSSAQEAAKPKADSDSQASRDAAVLEAVLMDVLTRRHPDSALIDGKELLFSPNVPDYPPLEISDIQQALKERKKPSPNSNA